MPTIELVNGNNQNAQSSPVAAAQAQPEQVQEVVKWRGREFFTGKPSATTFKVAFAVCAVFIALGIYLKSFVGGIFIGIGAFAFYAVYRAYNKPSELEEAATTLAGGKDKFKGLRTVNISKLDMIGFNPDDVTDPLMKVVDKQGKVIGVSFKYQRTALKPMNNEIIEQTFVKVLMFNSPSKTGNRADAKSKCEINIAASMDGEMAQRLESIFTNRAPFEHKSYRYSAK